MYSKLFLSSILFSFSVCLIAQNNPKGNLKYGSFKVGIKTLTIPQKIEGVSKQIKVTYWYPAKKNSNDPITLAEYLNYKNQISSSEIINEFSVMIGGEKNLYDQQILDKLISEPLKAVKDAKEINKSSPFLLWSSRYGTVEYQCIISEFLASHGYIVAYAEDIPNAAYPWQYKNSVDKEKALNTHIKELAATISYFKQHINISEDKIGLISWSYAGESAILSQINNQEIKCVVGLSSIGFKYGVYLGGKLAEKVDLKRLDVPYLILSEKIGTNGKTRTPPEFFSTMHSNSRYISFNALAHGNFNYVEGMVPGILKTDKTQSWSKGGEIAQLGYETICAITLAFLNENLRMEKQFKFSNQLNKIQIKLPKEFITVYAPKSIK